MRWVRRALFAVCALAFSVLPASAGTFETANLLRPGHFAFGLEPEFHFPAGQFFLFLHGEYGLTSAADLALKAGFGPYSYLGADVELRLVRETGSVPGLSCILGAHGTSQLGFDLGLNLSKRISHFYLYSSLRAAVEIAGSAWYAPAHFDLGVDIPLSRNADFFLEGDIALTPDCPNALAGGIKFYL